MPEMTEQEAALKIAEMWLDFKFNALTEMVPGDPDCDAVVLARQYVNAVQRVHMLKVILASLAEITSGMLQRIDMRDVPAVAQAQDIIDKVLALVRQTSPGMPKIEDESE